MSILISEKKKGHPCPQYTNPAEFILDLSTGMDIGDILSVWLCVYVYTCFFVCEFILDLSTGMDIGDILSVWLCVYVYTSVFVCECM